MDRINSTNPPSYPINKALSAYAKSPRVNRPAGAAYTTQAQGVRRGGPIDSASVSKPTDPIESVAKIEPSPMTKRAGAIGQLVGAKVNPINLSNDVAALTGPKPTVTSAGTYTLYPQAAERLQAATNIAANTNTGRSLDIRG